MPTTVTVDQIEKADVLDALSYFKTKADNAYLGNSGGLYPIVKVRSETGNTVTMSKGNTTLTATEDNGYWTFTIPSYGEWTINATGANQYQRVVPINVDDVKIYNKDARTVHRYGYRIKKAESDPYAKVEYLYDAEGMRPAYMNYNAGKFDYGDWADAWFVKDNKPCMLDSDGTVAYLLDPNDYSLRADGETPSDIADTSTTLNAMSTIPLVWVYRYEDDEYYYEIISDQKVDENYQAYAHTDANGTIKPYFYYGIYVGGGSSSKLRSLSAQTSIQNVNIATFQTAAQANGTGWDLLSYSQHELLRTLAYLMCKSTNVKVMFGYGYNGQYTTSGALNTGGQFKGYYNDTTHFSKFFHIENFWGGTGYFLLGFWQYQGSTYYKTTPENGGYTVNTNTITQTYQLHQLNISSVGSGAYWAGYVSCSPLGMFPIAKGGSETTYFCAYQTSNCGYACSGFGGDNKTSYGILPSTTNASNGYTGGRLAYV